MHEELVCCPEYKSALGILYYHYGTCICDDNCTLGGSITADSKLEYLDSLTKNNFLFQILN